MVDVSKPRKKPASSLNAMVSVSAVGETAWLIHELNKGRVEGQDVISGRWAIWMTGVGAGLGEKLLAKPGASATVCDFQVPYDNTFRMNAVREEGIEPTKKAVCRETASEMARAALHRAKRLADTSNDEGLYGMGITGALQTDRERSGGDVVYLAVTNGLMTWTIQIAFQRLDEEGNWWPREHQQLMVDMVALEFMLCVMGCADLVKFQFDESFFPARLFSPERIFGESRDGRSFSLTGTTFFFKPTLVLRVQAEALRDALTTNPVTIQYRSGAVDSFRSELLPAYRFPMDRVTLIPGSARPLHEVHRWMRVVAKQRCEGEPFFVITRTHAGGKPSPELGELLDRAEGFLDRADVMFLDGPYLADMVEQVRLIRGNAGRPLEVDFMLGMDVAAKLLDPSLPRCIPDLEKLRDYGARIYVVVRAGFGTRLSELLVGPVALFADLFTEIDLRGPEVSSTEIREITGFDRR